MKLDRLVRNAQNLLGSRMTRLTQNLLGTEGTRFIRELTGRSARHRIQILCRKELIGNGVDAWTICPDRINSNGVVYSIGVGNIIQSDLDLIRKFKVDVFAFDPTPGAIAWIKKQSLPGQFHFIEYGIMDFDGMAKFRHFGNVQFGSLASYEEKGDFIELPVHRLKTIMGKLGHERIHLLKMNIEGGEYAVIADLVRQDLVVDQIAVEFHHRLPGYSLHNTKQAVQSLNDHGYKIFHIADNGKEYSFLKSSRKD